MYINTNDDDFQVLSDLDIDPEGFSKDENGQFTYKDPKDEDDEEEEEEVVAPVVGKKKPTETKKPFSIDDEDYDALLVNHHNKKGIENNNTDDNTDEADVDTSKPVKKDGVFKAHYEAMVAADLWEEDEEFDGSEEKYLELLNKNREKERDYVYQEIIDEAFVNNPDGAAMGKAFLKHMANGGKVADFIQINQDADIDIKALDDEDEDVANSTAKRLLKDYYSLIGWENSRIEKKISKLEKTDELLDEAKDIEGEWSKQRTAIKETTTKQLEQQARARKEETKVYSSNLINLLNSKQDLGILSFKDAKEKAEIEQLLFQPASEGAKQTKLIAEINAALKDPQQTLILASLFHKGVHKDPKILGNPKQTAKNVKSDMEARMSAALQNKQISDKNLRNTTTNSASDRKRRTEDLDIDNVIMVS